MTGEELIMWMFFSISALSLGLCFGLWMDPFFRCKVTRKLTKKDYGIANLISKDHRTVLQKIVNFDQDAIIVNNAMWIISENRIYRKDKPEIGFKFKREEIRFEEGVPSIYVDIDSMKPLTFHKDDTNVKPQETASVVLSYIMNEMSKGLNFAKQTNTLLIIMFLLLVINVVLTFFDMNSEPTVTCSVGASVVASKIIPDGGTVDGDKIVIDQTNKTGG